MTRSPLRFLSRLAAALAACTAATGVDEVHVVMGGFHLSGRDFEPVIEPTTQALKAMRPRYVVPAHCTGRKAAIEIERQMPEQFLLNMSGTRMVFA